MTQLHWGHHNPFAYRVLRSHVGTEWGNEFVYSRRYFGFKGILARLAVEGHERVTTL